MKYRIDDTDYEVLIIKKNNKNTYIRINEDLNIVVTTNRFTTKSYILNLLEQNKKALKKMIDKQKKSMVKKESFCYLGNQYNIVEVSIMEDVEIDGDNIFVPNKKVLDKWLEKQIKTIFKNRLDYIYSIFDEVDNCPTLKIRSMKTRWGVYNRVKHNITLNSHLIEYEIDKIDYVIIHELSHVIHFDHSKNFWNLVSKYCPNYKQMRKDLKE